MASFLQGTVHSIPTYLRCIREPPKSFYLNRERLSIFIFCLLIGLFNLNQQIHVLPVFQWHIKNGPIVCQNKTVDYDGSTLFQWR